MENTLYCPALMEMNSVPHSEIIQTDCIMLSHSAQFEWLNTKTHTDRWMLLLIVCLSAIFILLFGTRLLSLRKTSSLQKPFFCVWERGWRNKRHLEEESAQFHNTSIMCFLAPPPTHNVHRIPSNSIHVSFL